MKTREIGKRQREVLSYLKRWPGRTARDIAWGGGSPYSPSAVSVVMVALEQRGYIDGNNRLTPEGEKALK